MIIDFVGIYQLDDAQEADRALPDRADAPDAASVRGELARILASQSFATSERMRALLEYLTVQTLEGHADRLKEYTIAIDVFGRGSDFDPRIETVVRTEAWRLRARLGRYYETEGAANPIRVQLAKRSFAVVAQRVPEQTRSLTFDSPVRSAAARVAVLPFVAVDDDGSLRWLGESLADEFSHALGRVPRIEVAARSSCRVMAASATIDACEAARRLGSTLLIEGSVRRTGSEVRLLIQLIDARSGCQLWAFADELAWRDEAGFVASTAHRLVTELMRSAPAWQTPLAEAFVDTMRLDADLRQILRVGLGSAPSELDIMRQGIGWLEARLRHAPQNAEWQLALTNLLATFITVVPASSADLMPRLRRCAHAATLEPGTATEGLVALGMASLFVCDWGTAQDALSRALSLSPQDCGALTARGLLNLQVGRLNEALDDIRLARELHPLSAAVTGTAAAVLVNCRRYGEAVDLARRAVGLDSDFKPAQALLADAMFWDGRVHQALGRLEELTQIEGRTAYALGKLGYVSARAGLADKARELLHELDDSDDDPARVSMARVHIQLGLGDHNAAFCALDEALEMPTAPELLLCSAPQFDPIRDDGRFAVLLARLSKGSGQASTAARPAAL
ncbi:hypothetical protein [Pandoraea bronchicola]|uniref:Uncharacterized protein n=1 Tax=Pandoraea bronchicola TaxID=2508287 RepID=A0A5E5C1T4_9BURK|nr:hypothetical protein [Pandoraea bronchicola]VVE90493.1 hypothetical protein PBR20603_04478 [Pandoraea bronchicola]